MNRRVSVFLVLALVIAGQALTSRAAPSRLTAQLQSTPVNDPLGHFEAVGTPGSVSWTGDDQRLSNPSFETGLAPWLQTQSNNASGSGVTLTTPGYLDSTSAKLSVNSGNSSVLSLISDSTEGLTDDLSQQKIAFNSATRFRAAIFVQSITGITGNDRVEVSLTMTTSTGGLRTIHYVIAQGSGCTGCLLVVLPSNSTTDGYLRLPGFGTTGSWISIDRDVPADAASVFPDASALNSVQSIALTVHAQSVPGTQMIDPHIKFWNSAGFPVWNTGEPVVYDSNGNNQYDSGETVIGCGFTDPTCPAPTPGTPLATDLNLKFVDTNHNGIWDCNTLSGNVCTSGESVVDDTNIPSGIVGVYDYGEATVIYNQPAPLPGTLLEKVVQGHTQALFDQVELYTATNGYNWVRNGGFEAGLAGWYTNSSFTSATAPVHSGAESATVSVTGKAAEMAQSIDARPQLDPGMRLTAYANLGFMTGTTASDYVDLWLGLDDSQGNALSLYYYFKTGTGTIPANRTDTINFKANGFGTSDQWLNLNVSLLQTIQSAVTSNGLSYAPPYTVEIMVLEASASSSRTTSSNFDDISLGTPVTQTGPASSFFYAVDGVNTTYVYTATSIPQGAFWLDIPSGRTLLNVTSPAGPALQPGDYTTSVSSGIRRITVLDSASFKNPVLGDWRFFTSSTNAVASVYAEDPSTRLPAPSVILNSAVDFVSQSKNPFNQPITNTLVNLTLWNINGVQEGSGWSGTTNAQGWFNATSITLPLAGTGLGIYRLQATVNSLYPGIRTFEINVHYTATIDMTLSTNNTNAGASITISGTVIRKDTNTPAQGVNVTIFFRLAGNSQWTSLVSVKTDASGKYTYTWNPPEGEYQVMAATSDSQTGVVNSSPAHLLVNPAGLPWLIIALVLVAAAAAAVIAFIVLRKRKKPASTAQPPTSNKPQQKS